jgi:hypothetical protein
MIGHVTPLEALVGTPIPEFVIAVGRGANVYLQGIC